MSKHFLNISEDGADGPNNYAIIRFEKLQNLKEIEEAEKHNSRLIKVINADKRLAAKNVNFRLSDEKLTETIIKRFAASGIEPRPTAILAFEVLMTFSPEMRDQIDTKSWAITSLEWAEKRWGSDNIVHAIMHYDEKTPHLHLVVTPLVKYSGPRNFKNDLRLNFRELLGGKMEDSIRKLSNLHTDYASAMEPFGLRRGVKNSKRVRRTIKEVYKETAILREEAEKEVADFLTEFSAFQKEISSESDKQLSPDQLKNLKAERASQLELLQTKVKDSFAKLIAKASTAWRADDLEKERRIFERRLDESREHYRTLIAQAQETIAVLEQVSEKKDAIINDLSAEARAILVEKAIEKLTGIAPIETGNEGELRFVFPSGLRILVSNGRFRNETPDILGEGSAGKKTGGRGAIDAVLFLKKWPPLEAIEWLAGEFSANQIASTVLVMDPTDCKDINKERVSRGIKDLTEKCTGQWPALREKLTSQGLDGTTIDILSEANWLNATAGGLVRLTRADEIPSPKPGTSKYRATGILVQDPQYEIPDFAFRLEAGENGVTPIVAHKNPSVIVCDDAIEALAIATRERALPGIKRSNIIVIGRKKTLKIEQFLKCLASKFSTIIFCVSDTAAAKAFVTWVQSIIPNAKLRLPQHGLKSHLEALSLPVEPEENFQPNQNKDPDF